MADVQDKTSKSRLRRFQFSLRTLLLLIVVCAGVSYYLRGMVRQWKHPVRGVVYLDGNPVTDGRGFVRFHKIDPEKKQPSYGYEARVRNDGSYVLKDGAVAGRYRVHVHYAERPMGDTAGTSMPLLIPSKYIEPETSGLAFNIPGDLTWGRLDLHLSSNGK